MAAANQFNSKCHKLDRARGDVFGTRDRILAKIVKEPIDKLYALFPQTIKLLKLLFQHKEPMNMQAATSCDEAISSAGKDASLIFQGCENSDNLPETLRPLIVVVAAASRIPKHICLLGFLHPR